MPFSAPCVHPPFFCPAVARVFFAQEAALTYTDHDDNSTSGNGISARIARLEERVNSIHSILTKMETITASVFALQSTVERHSETFSRLFRSIEDSSSSATRAEERDREDHAAIVVRVRAVEDRVNKFMWMGVAAAATATGMWGLFTWAMSGALNDLMHKAGGGS